MKSWIKENFQCYRWDILALLLLLLLPFVINFNVFFSVGPFPKIYPYMNDFVHSYSRLALTTDLLHDGKIGLWFPYRGFGMPLLGFPTSGMLYPPAVILS